MRLLRMHRVSCSSCGPSIQLCHVKGPVVALSLWAALARVMDC